MVRTGRPRSILKAYDRLADSGTLSADPFQREAAEYLEKIAVALEQREAGAFKRLFQRPPPIPRGLYLWGDVGRGKTFLMDLFFKTVAIEAKQRVHFHEFMDRIHNEIGKARGQIGGKGPRDPIGTVVTPIARELSLLCFDEFHVSDITNAMILQRVFERLFDEGVVVVATSNIPPDRLYEHGLNRQLFLPFISMLKHRTLVVELRAAKDYRMDKLSGQEIFFVGPPEQVKDRMNALWERMTGGEPGEPSALLSLGREIPVPLEAMGAARFPFEDLCEAPLGARDYLRLAHSFHTLMIDNVPHLGRRNSNAAKRFILLVDTLYDRGVNLAASFAEPFDILNDDDRTNFEFQRCKSRLIEMQSEDYLAAPRLSGANAIDTTGNRAASGGSIPLRQ